MCRWHKYPMKMAATDPETNEFDVGLYAIALTGIAMCRVEQDVWNITELFEIDGFNPEEIVTTEIQEAYKNAQLENLSLEETQQRILENTAKIREGLLKTAAVFSLTKQDLNITDNITAEGYKKTCCAPADPRESGPFLDAAVVYLFKGYDDPKRSYASKRLSVISAEELAALSDDPTVPVEVLQYLPRLEAIRAATEHFLEQDGMIELLEDTFKHSMVYIFQTAKSDIENGLGLRGQSNCIMCEGTKGRKKPNSNQPKVKS